MNQFDFKDRSLEMFEAVCNSSPWYVRHFTRNGLINGIKEEDCGNIVTEETMYVVCKKVTPNQHLEHTLEILDKIKNEDR